MFDVFVTGVNPSRFGELEQIRQNIRSTLGIDGENLDTLLTANGQLICVQENLPEEDANKTCEFLRELGLLCCYEVAQAKRWDHLAVESSENVPKQTFICKVCQREQPKSKGLTNEICLSCSKQIDHENQVQNEIAEIEALRKRMIYEAQLQEEQEEEQRLSTHPEASLDPNLEEPITLDLNRQTEHTSFVFEPSSSLQNFIVPGILFALFITAAIAYFFWPANLVSTPKLTVKSTSQPDAAQKTPDRAIIDITPSKKFPSLSDLSLIIPVPAVGEENNNDISLRACQNISQFLNSIINSANTNISENKNRIFINTLYSELDNDFEWDTYLNQLATQKINSDQFKTAFIASQFQANLSEHIEITSKLLAALNQAGRKPLVDGVLNKLNQRIEAQPSEMQAVYTAELALHLDKNGMHNSKLANAESLANHLTDPVKQSLAFSQLAVIEHKLGKTDDYNNYFAIAQEKLKEVHPSFEQFNGFINLTNQYTKIGNSLNAEVSLILAELSLLKLDANKQETGFASLLKSAYLINNPTYIQKYTEQIRNPAIRAKASLQSIEIQYNTNIANNINKQLSNISEADFLAVANATAGLIEADPVMQKIWFDNAEQQLTLIKNNEAKALASSRVARYLYRQGFIYRAQSLFEQAQNIALSLANPAQQDAVLLILAQDKARLFLLESANQTAQFIHNENLKADLLAIFKNQDILWSELNI